MPYGSRLGDCAPGTEVRTISGWVMVLRHGEMGISVRSCARKSRTVNDGRTGETKTFYAPQAPYVISSATPVYEARELPVM